MAVKYRKRPIVVEAEQFDPASDAWPVGVFEDEDKEFWIATLEGAHRVHPGDWIITGNQGERYPCKPDIFAATYEPA